MWRLSEISFLLPAVKWELPPAGLVSNCCHDCLDLSYIARYQKGAFWGVPNLPPLLWRQTKSAPGAPRRRRAKLGPEHNTSVGTLFSGASVSEGPRDEGLGFPEAPVWNFGGDRGGWPELFLHLGIDSVRMPRKNIPNWHISATPLRLFRCHVGPLIAEVSPLLVCGKQKRLEGLEGSHCD